MTSKETSLDTNTELQRFSNRRRARLLITSMLISSCLSLGVLTDSVLAQAVLIEDNFDDNNPLLPLPWIAGVGDAVLTEENQQLRIREAYGRSDPDSPGRTLGTFYRNWEQPLRVEQGLTLEVRIDLVRASQNDSFVLMSWDVGQFTGYGLMKDEDEIILLKYGADVGAWFFWEERAIKNENVTLSLSFTLVSSDLHIRVRVLDIDDNHRVLFERVVVDTPASDPVLPNRSRKGYQMGPDNLGAAWNGDGGVPLGVMWINPTAAPRDGEAEVIFDNLQAIQWATLTIDRAVVVTHPTTPFEVVLEGASAADGPWEEVTPYHVIQEEGLNRVFILAPESMELFRPRPPSAPQVRRAGSWDLR